MFFLIGGIFFKLGAMGANVLVEFKNIFLMGASFTIGGIFLKVGGKKLFWDQENQLFWELYGPH